MKLYITSLAWILLQCCIVGVGAVDCAPSSQMFTIKTAQDVSDIASCETFTGNIVVAANGPEEVSLDGIAAVNGNINVENITKLQSLSSKSLASVSGFTLDNLPQLSNLAFPALRNFSSLKWHNLPSLEDCLIATETPGSEVQEIAITETSLKGLDWLKWPVGSQLNVTGNNNLKSFSIPYNTINAGSALTFSDNPILSALDVSQLEGIYGGLKVSNNTKITQIFFSKLETIGGFVQMSGDFTNISMPVLNAINGALSVDSTANITALCNDLSQKKLAGHYGCTPNKESLLSTDPTTSGAPPMSTPSPTSTTSPTSPSQSSGSPSTGVKVGLTIGAIIITILILVLAYFYFRRRSRAKVREIVPRSKSPEVDSVELSESPTLRMDFPKELESPSVRVEIAAGREKQELPGVVPQELDARNERGGSQTRATLVGLTDRRGSVSSVTSPVRHELPA